MAYSFTSTNLYNHCHGALRSKSLSVHIFTPLQPQPPGSHPLPLHRQMAAVSATYKLLYPVPGHGHHRGRVTLPVAVLIGTREIFIRTTIKYPILRRQQIFTGIGIILLNIGWCGTLLSLPHWNFCRPAAASIDPPSI